jgi:hypothetical protein
VIATLRNAARARRNPEASGIPKKTTAGISKNHFKIVDRLRNKRFHTIPDLLGIAFG